VSVSGHESGGDSGRPSSELRPIEASVGAPREDPAQADGQEPSTSHGASAARRRKRRRGVTAVCGLVEVAGAVALPLALIGNSRPVPFFSLSPTAMLAASLGAARATHSVGIIFDEGGVPRDTLGLTPRVDVIYYNPPSAGTFELLPTGIYIEGDRSFSAGYGVSWATDDQYFNRWIKLGKSDGLLSAIQRQYSVTLSFSQQLDLLALDHVNRLHSRPGLIVLQGVLPGVGLTEPGLVGLEATITLSSASPHLPESLEYTTLGTVVVLSYRNWGTVPPLATPRNVVTDAS
jgi:hypothetical protein